jgi:hypothetical protein
MSESHAGEIKLFCETPEDLKSADRDNCKFLHDLEDYKGGWLLIEHPKSSSTADPLAEDESDEENESEPEEGFGAIDLDASDEESDEERDSCIGADETKVNLTKRANDPIQAPLRCTLREAQEVVMRHVALACQAKEDTISAKAAQIEEDRLSAKRLSSEAEHCDIDHSYYHTADQHNYSYHTEPLRLFICTLSRSEVSSYVRYYIGK